MLVVLVGWLIWKERNIHVFHRVFIQVAALSSGIQGRLWIATGYSAL
jgi:hypothetical protein